jgi:O-antigen/teichoic acid export membrane protein
VDDDASAHPERDDEWNREHRGETETERLDRNWSDLLQELRVVQTGVQLLTGFLLTLPFQSRFTALSSFEQNVYLATVVASVAATGFLIAPVSLHRTLFRRHARLATVSIAHRLALIGMVLLGCAILGVVFLVFDVLHGHPAGTVATAAAAVLLIALWLVLPWTVRARHGSR